MSWSQDPQKVVESILRKNSMDLYELMVANLPRIAGYFWKEGLIEKTTKDRMSTTGADQFNLATELLNACQPLLMLWPEENFPRFIAILKKFVTMVKLAQKMEDEFKKASMSWCISHVCKRLSVVMAYHVRYLTPLAASSGTVARQPHPPTQLQHLAYAHSV